ncbi:MAG: hypothetical protein H6644_13055 [Caldilineaceae bacterium]|nr:hypothetical protein [Caldilineaceae bacterium]
MKSDEPVAGGHELLYLAFLIRLWRDTPDAPWRASAQRASGKEIVHFGSVDEMLRFLRDHMGGTPDSA